MKKKKKSRTIHKSRKKEEKRRFKRHQCNIPIEYSVYSSKIVEGKTVLKNASKGGLRIIMKKNPFPETVIAIRVAYKRLARYVDFHTILLDTKQNPIVRVIHVDRDKKKKVFNVGVRFLPRPRVESEVNP